MCFGGELKTGRLHVPQTLRLGLRTAAYYLLSNLPKLTFPRENEELLKKVDLMFRRIELRDMDLQYDLFDEKKLKNLERWYTKN